jgi:hypothetical protein
MFDDFRDQVNESDFDEPEEEVTEIGDFIDEPQEKPSYFLGMTPVQRLIISVELLFMVCISGFLILLVLGRIEPPF